MITNTAISRQQYTLSTGTDALLFNFYTLDATHLKVWKSPASGSVPSLLVLNTDYVVSGTQDEAGNVTVTMIGQTVGDVITILRVPTMDQLLELVSGGQFHEESVEEGLDKVTMICFALLEQINRAIKYPPTEVDGWIAEIEATADRASKIIGFDENGALTVLPEIVENVETYGAVGDGVTNDTAAVQAALNSAIASGKVLYFPNPQATYLLTTDVNHTGLENVAILGQGATIKTMGTSGIKLSASTNVLTLSANVSHGDDTITVSDASGVAMGDIIELSSSIEAQLGWAYGSRWVGTVKSINGNVISLHQSVRMNFGTADSGISCVHSKGRRVHIQGLDFTTETGGARGVSLLYCIDSQLNEINSKNGPIPEDQIDCLFFKNCVGITIRDISLNGWRYGMLIEGGRNISVTNMTYNGGRHALSPAFFVDGVSVDGLRGENNAGIADAHPSFNIRYNNVYTSSDIQGSSFRCTGLTITNSRFRLNHATLSNVLGMNVAWNTTPYDYAALFDGTFDTYVENVEFITDGTGKPTVYRANTARLKNVRSVDETGALHPMDVDNTVTLVTYDQCLFDEVNSTDNAAASKETLYRGDIVPDFLSTMVNQPVNMMTGFEWTTAVTGSGLSNADASGWFRLSTGATAHSTAERETENHEWLMVASHIVGQFSFGVAGGFSVSIGTLNTTTNGMSEIRIGKVGSSSPSRTGFRLYDNAVWGVAEKDGVEQEEDLGITIGSVHAGIYPRPTLLTVTWDGSGTFNFYSSGSLIGTITGGPTGHEDGCGLKIYCENNADTAEQSICVGRIFLGWQLIV
ncbi:glycosyl hydrolase family 28-related protein [Rubellicoccus peritrichatus]|uniref:Glycosyl hydrolase family 28-related protein n=1 Tax=Rubellicoccus peritrichatus TaxID=3080537 RepID=A0AAQ3LGJ8_9BACT|nr:glycosyl hydrolase family 28-related protein [Puniceicoccus sp. CR14]WOO43480.1 glycosyl hydrolase family 28-related protein [Puniceicoccus sp. CR14]